MNVLWNGIPIRRMLRMSGGLMGEAIRANNKGRIRVSELLIVTLDMIP